MKLKNYMKKHGLSIRRFRDQTGLSIATISRICNGVNPPDWDTMDTVQIATDGKVKPNDFSRLRNRKPRKAEHENRP